MNLIHFAGEAIVGFVGERRGDNLFYASAAGSISQKSWVNSVAGNDSEGVWSFHAERIAMDGHMCQAPVLLARRFTEARNKDARGKKRVILRILKTRAGFLVQG